MPIRFRCAYCNQLLGISRRKAGTVVRCPSCAGQVVVPTLEEAGMEEKEEPAAPGTAASPLFEGNELDKLLEGAAGDQPSALPNAPPPRPIIAPSAPPSAAAPAGSVDRDLVPPPGFPTLAAGVGKPAGIFLSPARATLLSVLAVIALAIAFGAGLLVGLFLR